MQVHASQETFRPQFPMLSTLPTDHIDHGSKANRAALHARKVASKQ